MELTIVLPLNGMNGKFTGALAGREQDVPGFQGGLCPLGVANHHRRARGDPGGAEDRLDLVLLEQELQAVGQAFDDRVLAGQHCREVEADRVDLDAVLGEFAVRQVVELAGIQEPLCSGCSRCSSRFHPVSRAFSTQATFIPSCARGSRRRSPRAGTNPNQVVAI